MTGAKVNGAIAAITVVIGMAGLIILGKPISNIIGIGMCIASIIILSVNMVIGIIISKD